MNIEWAPKLGGNLEVPRGRPSQKAQPSRKGIHSIGGNRRRPRQAETERLESRPLEEVPPQRIILIDDSEPRQRPAGALEEPLFGPAIGFHRPVEVEVIARQVRKDDRMKVHPMDPLQLQGVRGNFQGGMGSALLLEFG